jgi:hypothetical protein
MSTVLTAGDATFSLLQKLRKQNMHLALLSPVSFRFTASTPANLAMGYNAKPSESGGRAYIELLSLLPFYKSLDFFGNIAGPYGEQSINTYQVPNFYDFALGHILIFVRNFQGRWHWGQYMTPSFTTLQYQLHDPDFYASIGSFKSVAEEFDPGHMMANKFLNKVIWLVPDN